MLQESGMDIQRSPQSTEAEKDELEAVQKGHGGAEEGLEIEEAGIAKRSRLRMVAIVTALFVRLNSSFFLLCFSSWKISMNFALVPPTNSNHVALPLRLRS